MGFVHDAAVALAEGEPAPVRAFARVIETGIVVTYARAYLESNHPPLGKKFWPKAPDDLALHNKVVDDYRHGIHAHSHRTKRRTLLDTADLLGLDGPPTYAEAWHGLTKDDLSGSLISLTASRRGYMRRRTPSVSSSASAGASRAIHCSDRGLTTGGTAMSTTSKPRSRSSGSPASGLDTAETHRQHP
jgi:hypothetical protein